MSNTPKILRALLLLLVVAGLATWAWRNFGPASTTATPPTADGQGAVGKEPDHLVVVTYFTSDKRCKTCLKIEKQTREAIEKGFAEALGSGDLRFQSLNFDRPENKHFMETYGLTFKTVVVSDRHLGKETAWAKYDDVWDLVDDPAAFARYLQDGVRKYLKPQPATNSNSDA